MQVTIKFPTGDVELDAYWLSDDMARHIAASMNGNIDIVYHLSTGEDVIGHTVWLLPVRSRYSLGDETIMARFNPPK